MEPSQRKFYLEDIPLDEALQRFREALEAAGLWRPLRHETIPLAEANGRTTAEPVWARLSSPHFHSSAMDGYAVRAVDTAGATETAPLTLELVGGGPAVGPMAQAINTGHPLPSWANAVIMIEHAQPVALPNGRDGILIRAAVPPWQHVRPMGEDIVATELVLPANHLIRPVDLGAIAGSGHAEVTVYARPRVAIIPTGSELVSITAGDPQPGQIIEYNSLVLAAQVASWGGVATRWPIVADDFAAIQSAVRDAVQSHDLVLLNAGSSAGSEDYTAHVVESLGDLLVHGVAVRPGHPVILGLVRSAADAPTAASVVPTAASVVPTAASVVPTAASVVATAASAVATPIIGVPGFPVSAALTGEIFVQPLLARWQGQQPVEPPTIEGVLSRKVNSSTGDDDFVRVAVGKVGDDFTVTPLSRGAGIITSLVRADGILRIPRFTEGHNAGDRVTVHLYRRPNEIARTIVVIGSHDLTLDLMSQFLAERHDGLRLTSANVGSLGGLLALQRGEAHVAGSHLLDPQTGEYNVSYVQRYLPGQPAVGITLAGREQGWIVAPGNPLALRGWVDAARPDVSLVNRQRGAGTRVLLDYELGKLGITEEQVRGYEREEYTHLAVAAAVASGAADAGLGIRAAARALNLDFVPLANELYELIIPVVHFESDLLRPLRDLLADPVFRQAVAALPGYDVGEMGHVRPFPVD